MADLKQKIKLIQALKKLGEQNPEYLLIPQLMKEIESTRESIPSPFDDRPLVQEINDLKYSLSSVGDQIRDSIREIAENVNLTLAEKDAKAEEIIKKLTDEIKKVEKEFIFKLSQVGGGSMNRQIRVNGVDYLTKYTDINLIGSITAVSNNTTKRVDITFAGSSGGGYQQPTSGSVNGSNATFVWATAPSVIVVDGVPRQKVQSDGTINWTVSGSGPYTTILSIAPNFDIFGI